MASLKDLRTFFFNTNLQNKVAAAVAVTINKIITNNDSGPPFSQNPGDHDLRVAWAREHLGNSVGQAQIFVEAVLAKNSTSTEAQIQAAIDSEVEADVDVITTNIESVIDLVAGVPI